MKLRQNVVFSFAFTILLSEMVATGNQNLLFCMAFLQFGSPRASRVYSSSTLLSAKKTKRASSRVGDFWEAKMDDVWRPEINDVERISWGKPAKKKGTGSRGVPHRLNLDERFLFDNARRKGFMEMEGSGWRSQRREAPLLNTYRSLCDARGQASIVLHKGSTGVDELVVDISPLRNPEMFLQIAKVCLEQEEGGEILSQGSGNDDFNHGEDLALTLSIVDNDMGDNDEPSPWDTRPIYQLPPFCISWELQRDAAKVLGKKMAHLFDTIEDTATPSKKPAGVKPGKGRRHGGYGIG